METSRIPMMAVALLALAGPVVAATRCPPDSVKVGTACVDKYEASVWSIPLDNKSLVRKVLSGKAEADDLTAGATGGPFGRGGGSCLPGGVEYPPEFPGSGQWTPIAGSNPPSPGIFAVSVAGVEPSRCISWFQAAQACALAGKRLATNREWQDAAAGTPDGAPCNVTGGVAVATGADPGCVSNWGAFDMVGNVWEWVADWVPNSTTCTGWDGPSGDFMCLAGASTTDMGPGALRRGGDATSGTGAGPLAVSGGDPPTYVDSKLIGFRCAR